MYYQFFENGSIHRYLGNTLKYKTQSVRFHVLVKYLKEVSLLYKKMNANKIISCFR